jgi:hypothetical protein
MSMALCRVIALVRCSNRLAHLLLYAKVIDQLHESLQVLVVKTPGYCHHH